MSKLFDTHGRAINYLRLSITDRCNLRCAYCHTSEEFIPHSKVLRYEEMEAILALFIKLGVQKVRFTGGEPLLRNGFMDFLARVRDKHPELQLRITTNGVLTAPHVKALKALGIIINLSLDTLDRAKFEQITGSDKLDDVKRTLDELIAENVPFKLNAVALKGINDDELAHFLALAKNNPLDMRFIEFMPMGQSTIWSEKHVWKSEEILESAKKIVGLEKLNYNNNTDGPASMYKIAGGKGRFGIISPITNHYCQTCNRMRVTSEGMLRSCLYDDTEYSLRSVLRDERIDDALGKERAMLELVQKALATKPIGSDLLKERDPCSAVARKNMFTIGG